MIQRTILTKRIDFKLQTKISVISSIISGVIGITLAFLDFGVWSLVAKQVTQRILNSFFLWIWNRWRPLFLFSKKSFLELFSFGSKILISRLIDTFFGNIYYLIIGKYFSAQELGFYTRADQFKNLPSQNIQGIISRVSFPVLAQMQDDIVKLKLVYKKLIKSTMLITFVLMLGMAAVAEPMIIALIGEKWRPAIDYVQMLSFIGMIYPLHALNLNMLNVRGRSDLYLKLEIIKKILTAPTVVIGVLFGIKIMIVSMMINNLIAYYINSYWSGKHIGYTIKEQLTDILPSFILALVTASIVYVIGMSLPYGYLLKLLIQVISGGIIIFVLLELFKINAYLAIKEIITSYQLSTYTPSRQSTSY